MTKDADVVTTTASKSTQTENDASIVVNEQTCMHNKFNEKKNNAVETAKPVDSPSLNGQNKKIVPDPIDWNGYSIIIMIVLSHFVFCFVSVVQHPHIREKVRFPGEDVPSLMFATTILALVFALCELILIVVMLLIFFVLVSVYCLLERLLFGTGELPKWDGGLESFAVLWERRRAWLQNIRAEYERKNK